LRKLALLDVNVNPTLLESLIADLGCPGLEGLCVSKACWYDHDFSRLSDALVSHAANRRVLEWTWYDSHRPSQLFRPFGSLRGLQDLTRLALDYTLMTPSSGGNDAHPIHLLDPQGYDEARLLYRPGYEAPWPHLNDLDQGLWIIETFRLWEIKTGQKPRPNLLNETLLAEELSDNEEEP
jgi:hypothetical protein